MSPHLYEKEIVKLAEKMLTASYPEKILLNRGI